MRLINQAQEEQKRDIIEVVEEKFERRLSEEIADLKVELSQRIADSEVKLTQKIADSDVKSGSYKAEIIKWMFIFWVGQVAVILGILFTFFKQ